MVSGRQSCLHIYICDLCHWLLVAPEALVIGGPRSWPRVAPDVLAQRSQCVTRPQAASQPPCAPDVGGQRRDTAQTWHEG